MQRRVDKIQRVLLFEPSPRLERGLYSRLVPRAVDLQDLSSVDRLAESDGPSRSVPDQLSAKVRRHVALVSSFKSLKKRCLRLEQLQHLQRLALHQGVVNVCGHNETLGVFASRLTYPN
eukprot:3237660-Rhodomonas_salina.1